MRLPSLASYKEIDDEKLFALFAALMLICSTAFAAVNINTASQQELEALKA